MEPRDRPGYAEYPYGTLGNGVWRRTVVNCLIGHLLSCLVMLSLNVIILVTLLGSDNPVSHWLDQSYRLRQQRWINDCTPCPVAADTNCCTQLPDGTADRHISIDKLVAAAVDEQIQRFQARDGNLLVTVGNATLPPSNVQCAAHLVLRGSQQPITRRSGGYETVVGWDYRGQSAFIRPCIQYNNRSGLFLIHQDGLYVVTSHLGFSGPHQNTEDLEDVAYGQQVKRSTSTEPILVNFQIRVAESVPRRSSSMPVHDSVASGVARLRRGERIYVEAKPVNLLVRNNWYSAFSVIKLQDGLS